jgi:hypothetical protein
MSNLNILDTRKRQTMNSLSTLVASTAVLIAVFGAIQFVVLAFRNPFRPAWLKRKSMDNLAGLGITTASTIAFGYEIVALVAIGLHPIVALAVVSVFVLVVMVAIWRVFGCGERLRRADAGLSPFHRQPFEGSAPAAHAGT